MQRRFRRLPVAAFLGTALIAPLVAAPASAAPAPVVVAAGLNNPRQLSLTNNGVLLVAEAGTGGSKCVGSGDSAQCIGNTGSIDAIANPKTAVEVAPNRIITGLLSGSGDSSGMFATGVDGVSTQNSQGTIWMAETYAPPETFPQGINDTFAGKLLYGSAGRTPLIASDVSLFEKNHDPDKQGFDSNPYSVLDLGDHRLVSDAAANDVLSVQRNGKISVFHVFPNITTTTCTTPTATSPGYDPTPAFPGCDFVPTSLAQAPDGDILVGGLASEAPGQGEVVRLSSTGNYERTYTGFTSVTGVAVGLDNDVYVSQLEAPQFRPTNPMITGVVTRILNNGHRDNLDVPFPAGVAVDKGNNVFVSAWSVATSAGLAGPGTDGQVWKLRF